MVWTPMLNQDKLKSILTYDPDTGIFTRDSIPIGLGVKVARCIRIQICGEKYAAHRLAWLYMTGAWPTDMIDHINGNARDNRWCNLREATAQENLRNQGLRPCNKLGLKGVSLHKHGKYRAAIKVNKKQISLGYYKCPAAAHFAYVVAARRTLR
jgi:hypothetical protein